MVKARRNSVQNQALKPVLVLGFMACFAHRKQVVIEQVKNSPYTLHY
tara:strand:- start:25 stop:165 length:141 start_codon:yes stop_codon:yes gene_type:complete